LVWRWLIAFKAAVGVPEAENWFGLMELFGHS